MSVPDEKDEALTSISVFFSYLSPVETHIVRSSSTIPCAQGLQHLPFGVIHHVRYALACRETDKRFLDSKRR